VTTIAPLALLDGPTVPVAVLAMFPLMVVGEAGSAAMQLTAPLLLTPFANGAAA
jgi:hypothetical protein